MNLILDWLGREGGAILSWWLLSLGAALAVYPLLFRLARGLPSRGYALARVAGLLLSGFIFWILNILGLFHNDPGDALLSGLILFVIGLVGYLTWRDREPIIPWVRAHWRLIVVTEAVFAVAFFSWVLVRALNPDVTATEKPMEMAFLTATRRSATFPPNDPWMSGYAISYYHFGYILVATLANLSGVNNGLMFNLAAALLFGLTCVSAFGVGYDLVASRQAEKPPEIDRKTKLPKPLRGRWTPYAVGILAAVLLAVMGNLYTALIEEPYQFQAMPSGYFRWMDVAERDSSATAGCTPGGQVQPTCYWWWFRSSRIVRDHNLDGSPNEIIDEFPQFSFVLSDIHPHVLALPFTILALGLMLNLVLSKRGLYPWEFVVYIICIGGLVFLNSWDLAYLGVFVGAEALRRLIRNGTGSLMRSDWLGIAGFAVASVALTVVLYLPFLISFRSQAGGFLPNVIWPTQFQQFFVMFGTFLVILGTFVGVEIWRAHKSGHTFNLRLAAQTIGYSIAALVILVLVLGILAWLRPDIRGTVFRITDASGSLLSLILEILQRRLWGVVTEGVLLALIFGVVGRLFAREPARTPADPPVRRIITYSPTTGFVLLLIGAGAVLALAPDFVYLHDDFGSRMNTIFKLYYQTWTTWSLASAYAIWSLLGNLEAVRLPVRAQVAFGTVATIFVAAGLIFAPLAINSRAIIDGGHTSESSLALTLDGAHTLAIGADDYAAISCLNTLVPGDGAVVAEGMVDPMAYNNQYGRVSALTGIPTLMGWSNHENQWRGSTYPEARGTRIEDEATLYNTPDWKEAQSVIQKYHITYVYVGPTERLLYAAGGGLSKFENLTPVCKSGEVSVYATSAMPPQVASNTTGGGS